MQLVKHIMLAVALLNFLHFLWSIAFSLHICLVSQSFSVTSLQVFFGLPLGLTPSTSRSMHFFIFTQSFSAFLKTCSYHLHLCHCITVIISSIPSLSLNSLHVNLSVILTPNIHLIILISALLFLNCCFSNFVFEVLADLNSTLLNARTVSDHDCVKLNFCPQWP